MNKFKSSFAVFITVFAIALFSAHLAMVLIRTGREELVGVLLAITSVFTFFGFLLAERRRKIFLAGLAITIPLAFLIGGTWFHYYPLRLAVGMAHAILVGAILRICPRPAAAALGAAFGVWLGSILTSPGLGECLSTTKVCSAQRPWAIMGVAVGILALASLPFISRSGSEGFWRTRELRLIAKCTPIPPIVAGAVIFAALMASLPVQHGPVRTGWFVLFYTVISLVGGHLKKLKGAVGLGFLLLLGGSTIMWIFSKGWIFWATPAIFALGNALITGDTKKVRFAPLWGEKTLTHSLRWLHEAGIVGGGLLLSMVWPLLGVEINWGFSTFVVLVMAFLGTISLIKRKD